MSFVAKIFTKIRLKLPNRSHIVLHIFRRKSWQNLLMMTLVHIDFCTRAVIIIFFIKGGIFALY